MNTLFNGNLRGIADMAKAISTVSELFGNPEQLALLAGCGGAIAPPFL